MLSMPRAWVRSLVGELRSRKPCSEAKTNLKIKKYRLKQNTDKTLSSEPGRVWMFFFFLQVLHVNWMLAWEEPLFKSSLDLHRIN